MSDRRFDIARCAWPFIIAVLISFSIPARAGDRPYKVTAQVGLNGFIYPGRWAPVEINGENTSPDDLKGLIRIKQTGVAAEVETPLELPGPRSEKRIFAYYPVGSQDNSITVEYDFEPDGRVLIGGYKFENRKQLPEEGLIIGIAGYQKEVAGRTGGVILLRPGTHKPDHWAGYDILDRLVIERWDSTAWDPNSARAVLDWVRRGGLLVVPAEPDPGDALSAALSSQIDVDIDPGNMAFRLNDLSNSLGIPVPEGRYPQQVVCRQFKVDGGRVVRRTKALDGTVVPLAISAPLGSGQVVMLGCSLRGDGKFRDWPHNVILWDRLLERPKKKTEEEQAKDQPQYFIGNPEKITASRVFGALFIGSMRERVTVWRLVLLTIVYLIVIGPVDYFVIKRLRRPLLTWITFPATVFVFSLVGYIYAIQIKVGDLAVREITFRDVTSGQPNERIQGYAGLVSPQRNDYKVYSSYSGAFIRTITSAEGDTQRIGAMTDTRPRISQDEKTHQVMRIRIPVSTVRAFRVDGLRASPKGRAPLTVSKDGGEWVVENNYNGELKNCVLIRRHGVLSLKNIPPGTHRFKDRPKNELTSLHQWAGRGTVGMVKEMMGESSRGFASDTPKNIDMDSLACVLTFGRIAFTWERDSYYGYGYGGEDYEFTDPSVDRSHVIESGDALLFARLEGPDAEQPLLEVRSKWTPQRRKTPVWIRCRIPQEQK